MKVFVKNKGEVNLTNDTFLTQGGEGSLYVKGNKIFKIYHDSSKMIPTGKIDELSVLTNQNIIKPQDVILDNNSKPIGYTMEYIKHNYALCQLFPKAFRDRNNITPEIMFSLIRKLQYLIKDIHDKNILVVDLNEMNFLSSQSFDQIYAIDCDSYQTKSYPATAIMDSIKDRHSKSFSNLTDWFSFGIIAFMMFCGIHPYKGKSKKFKSLDERMINNISVLNKDVSVPNTCYPFTIIPKIYLDWFKAIFDDGKRMEPPFDLNIISNISLNMICSSNSDNFSIVEIASYNDLQDIDYLDNKRIVKCSNKLYYDNVLISSNTNIKLVSTPKNSNIIGAYIENNNLKLYNFSFKKEIPISIIASDIINYDNRFFVKSINSVIEITFMENTNNIIPIQKNIGNLLEHASIFYEGVIIQNLLGSYYISLFGNAGQLNQIRIKELDKYKIFHAKYDNKVLMVVGNKNGKYDKLIFRFDNDYSYDVRYINDISYSEVNFVTLDTGVCVHINDDDVEIFSNKKGSNTIKLISDSMIDGNIHLLKNGNKIEFIKNNKLFSFSMKK